MKTLWNKLAEENARYFINSDYGRGITEEKFRVSGFDDCEKYIVSDKLFCPDIKALRKFTFLEIGCGTGRMTEFLPMLFKKMIGIDISGSMIRLAKKRLKKYPNIELIETDGEIIPLEDNSVDLAFSYLVFQHMKSRVMVEKNFKEVHRVLRTDGLFKVRIRSDKVDLNKWWGGSRIY